MDDKTNDMENGIGKPIDRRSLLKLMAVMGVQTTAGVWMLPAHAQTATPKFELENPKYLAMYDKYKGFYFQDPEWIKFTTPRLTWPKEGEKVPELTVVIPSNQPDWLDGWRKWAKDAEQIGLKYNLVQTSSARWLEEINGHRHGDIEVHPSILRPERVDPGEWLVSRAYGLDRRNYGEWVNEQYDALIDKQTAEADPKKRLEHVKEAQKVLADDLYTNLFGWGPTIIEAYNAGNWEGMTKTVGFGMANFNAMHGFLKAKSKNGAKSLKVGMTALLETTNIIGASNNMRSIGRMIYDRLAYFDENLNVIPWAVESWKSIDNRTWDIKLRPGMEFHDGKPVTIEDLKFTFDFMMKYERGIFWSANQFLESTEIVDAANGVLRTRFKAPYGQFESFFLQLNVILPKHIFQNIMAEQNVGDNPRQLRIDRPIGSGPYRFGRYRKDTELQLIANKKHFAKPVTDEIWVVVTPTLDGLMGRLESGEIDVIESTSISLSPSQADQVAKHKHVKVERTKDVNWYHGVVRVSNLPWRDYQFRLAWQHSIDRAFLVNVAWEGAGRVPTSNTFLIEGNPWHNPNLPKAPQFDLAKARQILKDAGYTWASDGRLVYPSSKNANFRKRVTQVSKDGYKWGGLKMFSDNA
jgi:peptide/nickel transport system substrate-binding protein